MTVLANLPLALALAATLDVPSRWPSWPNELDRIAQPLLEVSERAGHERQRLAALSELEPYAPALIEPFVVRALRDPSAQVRREALRLCHEHRLDACVPVVIERWTQTRNVSLRTQALPILAWDGRPQALELLLEALRDNDEKVRSEAAAALGVARIEPEHRNAIRTALLAKLADPSAMTRRRVAQALGLLGPGDGALALARLLDDPEPAVRAAAAEGLGLMGAALVVPSLARAIEAPNESSVRFAALEALAKLPGHDVDELLLGFLDAPPNGLGATQVAEAIALRPDPRPELLAGLVERLNEPTLREPALRALLIHAERAEPQLRAALERGLEPALALEVERLLLITDPEPQAAPTHSHWPDRGDRDGWTQRLGRGSWLERLRAAQALSENEPPWLAPHLEDALERLPHPEPLRGWLAAAVPGSQPLRLSPWARARLLAWARDRGLGASDRCLAAFALARVESREDTWYWLFAEPAAAVRSCALVAGARSGALDDDALALALVDSAPTVRLAALMALSARLRWPRNIADTVALLGSTDPDPEVRQRSRTVLQDRGDSRRWHLQVEPSGDDGRRALRMGNARWWLEYQ